MTSRAAHQWDGLDEKPYRFRNIHPQVARLPMSEKVALAFTVEPDTSRHEFTVPISTDSKGNVTGGGTGYSTYATRAYWFHVKNNDAAPRYYVIHYAAYEDDELRMVRERSSFHTPILNAWEACKKQAPVGGYGEKDPMNLVVERLDIHDANRKLLESIPQIVRIRDLIKDNRPEDYRRSQMGLQVRWGIFLAVVAALAWGIYKGVSFLLQYE